ncbi:thioredoxin trx1 [Tieghemiomyces parasiticus]|uniref:Thioredoxin trx1 n=1 Tax=Tieghemiomyces parasiticus TaxID=78921 RepID=A0A9W7ZY68_9FUNG|nr:thioredoxin trx1 [Tieghemiomyces parasiticus]
MTVVEILFFLVVVFIFIQTVNKSSTSPSSSSTNPSSNMAGKVVEVKSKAEFENLIKANARVIVDFSATWCGPCKAIAPIFAKLSEAHGNIKFVKVDVDEVAEVAREYNVTAMPTFLFIKDGSVVGEPLRGANPSALGAQVAQFAA